MRRVMKAARSLIRISFEIFDDWLTRTAGIVCLLIIAVVIFNMNSEVSETYPLLGTIIYAMVPVLFLAGGVIFIVAILRFSERGNNDETS